MKLEQFIDELYLENNNTRSYDLFETFILKLLGKYLEEQSKNLVTQRYSRFKNKISLRLYDGYVPDGVDDLPGATVVEIKLFRKGIQKNLFVFKDLAKTFVNDPNVKSLLLILGTKLTSNDKELLNKYFEGITCKIWDLEDLSNISEKYHQYVSDIIPKLSEAVVNGVVSKSLDVSPNDWKKTRKELVNELKNTYKNDDLVLVLGAGVSKKAGISDWNTLVSDLLVKMINDKLIENEIIMNDFEQQEIVTELKNINEASPLLQARYIRTGLGSSFINVLSKLVYKNFDNTNFGTSDLLKSISKLCLPRRRGLGIRAVITYNFDDLIEKNIEVNGGAFKTIYRDVDIASQEELGIYHVHGFLPRNGNENEISSDNLLVFSEERYHSLYLDPYSWSNITQLNFLRENTCLMLGLSITDPNLRRLLDIAAGKNEVTKHFVILKKPNFSKNIKNDKTIRKYVIQKFADVDEKLQEKSFEELGLNIIWIEDYDEIPQILDSIRS